MNGKTFNMVNVIDSRDLCQYFMHGQISNWISVVLLLARFHLVDLAGALFFFSFCLRWVAGCSVWTLHCARMFVRVSRTTFQPVSRLWRRSLMFSLTMCMSSRQTSKNRHNGRNSAKIAANMHTLTDQTRSDHTITHRILYIFSSMPEWASKIDQTKC